MRLIDADALIDDIKNCLWDWESVDGITATTVLMQTITDIINQPSVDAVPVVRCGECKHGYKMGAVGVGSTEFYIYCNKPHAGNWTTHKEDWYCANGKKKEDDNEAENHN